MIVVADTSILLNLCAVQQVELLRQLFADVRIPQTVRDEFDNAAGALARFCGLTLPAWISISPEAQKNPPLRAISGLDPGELAALELALEIKADAVLVDEMNGRRAAAVVGLRVFGILGILLRAKAAGLLPAVAPVLESLKAVRFFLSSHEQNRCLTLAGELPQP